MKKSSLVNETTNRILSVSDGCAAVIQAYEEITLLQAAALRRLSPTGDAAEMDDAMIALRKALHMRKSLTIHRQEEVTKILLEFGIAAIVDSAVQNEIIGE